MKKKLEYSLKTDLLVCTLLVLVVFVLRIWHIGDADIGNDECFSLYYAQFTPTDIIQVLCRGDNPPLWELLLHGWIKVFGFGILSMRLLSLIFSVFTVIPVYLIGKHLPGRCVSMVAGSLYAVSTISIFLSHDGRVYSLVGILAAFSFYFFLLLAERPSLWRWSLWVIVNLLLIYSHYLAWWVVVMEVALWLLVPSVRSGMGKGMLWAFAAMAVLYLPIVPTLIRRFADSGLHGTWIERCHGIDSLYSMLCCFSNAPVTTVLSIALMLSAMVKSLVRIVQRGFVAGPLTWITLMWVVPLLVSFGLSFLVGFFLNRYFYFLVPFYLLSLAAYVEYLFPKRRIPAVVLSVMLVAAMAASVRPDSSRLRYAGWKGDVSAVAKRMNDLKGEEEVTIIAPDWIDKQIVFYLDDKHQAFQSEGTLDEPVFRQYLEQKGYRYECDYQEFDYSACQQVVIVHGNDHNITGILNHLSGHGFQQSQQEVFQQMTLTILTHKQDL